MAVRRSNTHEYYVRGENVGADADAIIATKKQKVKLASWDKCLKEFKYHKAIDAAMNVFNSFDVSFLVQTTCCDCLCS